MIGVRSEVAVAPICTVVGSKMKIDRIGEIILTRQLMRLGADEPIIIEIGRPEKYPDEESFFCAYQLIGLGHDRVRYAVGVDQVQSLLLALKKIGAYLYSSSEYKAGRLYWLERGNRDLGFPTPDGFEVPSIKSGSDPSLRE